MMNLFEKELNDLLNEDSSVAQNRAHTMFDPLQQKIQKNGIILFGCGAFGNKILKGLREIGIEPIGFSDNNSKIWNTKIDNLNVFSPEEAANKFSEAVFMVTIWSDVIGHPTEEITEKLHSFKNVEVTSFFSLFWKYPKVFMPYFSIDSPYKTLWQVDLIKKCFSLFKDEESQKEFVAQIRLRLNGDYKGLTLPGKFTQYFYDDLFLLNNNDVFVDCGAFDGDTIKNFLIKQDNVFSKYYALEPDPVNCDKLKAFVTKLPSIIRNKVIVKECAVSDTNKKLNFSSDGSLQSSISETGNILVDCISIDEGIDDPNISYIKMDTEGAEPDIIKGALKTIKKNSPILAISVYHVFDHLWTLPLQVNEISNNYEFYLRPHCKASWDLICYAVPNDRLLKK